MPIGGAYCADVVEAKCEAGGVKPALEFCTVKRIAWLMTPAFDFIVANQAGKNRKSSGVSAGPGVRALLIGCEIPDGGRSCVPIRRLWIGAVQFVEKAGSSVEHENVAIAVPGIGVAFNRCGERNGHGAGVAFAAIRRERDGNESLRRIYDRIRDTDGGIVILSCTKVGMQADGTAYEIDDGCGVRIDRRGRDVFIPEIVGRKWNETVQAGTLSGRHTATTRSLHRSVHLKRKRVGPGAAWIGVLHGNRVGPAVAAWAEAVS